MNNFKTRVRNWWDGRFIPYENDPNDSVVIIGGNQEWHWTARVARRIVAFLGKEWKWVIGTILAVIALVIAL